MNNRISFAMEFAMKKHKGQKYSNGDYFENHCLVVYDLIKHITNSEDSNLMIAGLLHDTLEDTDTTYEELLEHFGHDITELVYEVTNPSKDKKNYFPNLKTQRGFMLKFADRLANISNMEEWDEERKQKYMKCSVFWER